MPKPAVVIGTIIEKIKRIHAAMYEYTEFSNAQKNRLVVYIILLMTISQTAVTIYLPSMPNMAIALKTRDAHIQLSLTLYLIGYGCSQFFYGPLSDIYGRRLIILWGMGLFVFASFFCAIAPGISIFLVARMLQGIGMGCGDTMGRAILCDCFKDKQFVKAASYIGMAATITPLVAPIMGGYFEEFINWRASFVFLFLYGMVNALIMLFYLPETRPQNLRGVSNFKGIMNAYWFVLRNRVFLGFFIPGLVSFVGEMLYNMMGPFLIQENLGWGPVAFGWLSTFIVVGLLIGTLIANRLSHHVSNYRMVLTGMCLLSFAGVSMLLSSILGHICVTSIILPMVIFMIGVGITYPNTNMGALTPFTAMAGIAGALQGGMQMLCGGVVGVILSRLHDQSQYLLALTLTFIAISGLIAFVQLLKPRSDVPKEPVAAELS